MRKILKTALACLCGLLMLTSCGQEVRETSVAGGETSSAERTTTAETSVTSASTSASASAVTTVTAVTTAAPPPVEEITEPYCRAAMVYCVADDKVLYSKAADEQISLASITKLLTAATALKYLSPETVITVGSEIWLVKPDSALAYLPYGTKIKLYDLLGAMLLPSGNDAAYAVAAATARAMTAGGGFSDSEAVEFFVGLMNGFAQDLGMKDSHFANPEGWDDPQHYTTANDLMKLVKYVWTIPEIREIAGEHQKVYHYPEGGEAVWKNTNLLVDPGSVFYDAGCKGIKTGTTASAGCCLVSAFEKGGKTYLCEVMGCYDDSDRFTLTKKLIEAYAA